MNETELKIKIFGDPALRSKAKQVKEITQRHKDILSQMSRIMYDSSGIGLASSQIGIEEAMLVVDIGSGLYKLINPRIVEREGLQVLEEGCLSVPGVCIKVKRAKKVLVEALDEYGKAQRIEAQDLLACVFQHEIDHLQGRLIVDYASFFDRLKIKRILEELKRKTRDEKLSESKDKSCKLQL
jgi:peptide deformylase